MSRSTHAKWDPDLGGTFNLMRRAEEAAADRKEGSMITLDQLKDIAARLKACGTGYLPRVEFGTRETESAVADLIALGAADKATTWDPSLPYHPVPYTIVSADLKVDGVTFSAQFARDATEEECAALKGPDAHHTFQARVSVDAPVKP